MTRSGPSPGAETRRPYGGAGLDRGSVHAVWRRADGRAALYIRWNFVSSRPERIEQAKEEWARGRFDTAPGDAEEFIPLPKTQDRPREPQAAFFFP